MTTNLALLGFVLFIGILIGPWLISLLVAAVRWNIDAGYAVRRPVRFGFMALFFFDACAFLFSMNNVGVGLLALLAGVVFLGITASEIPPVWRRVVALVKRGDKPAAPGA